MQTARAGANQGEVAMSTAPERQASPAGQGVATGGGVLSEFKKFLLRGNVVDLAVAVVVGTAFTVVVNSLVTNLLTPLIAAIFGEQDFSALTFTINGSVFRYGAFINSLITFVTVAAAVFFFVVLPLNRLAARRARGESSAEDEPEPSEEAVLLTEIRDLLAGQSGNGRRGAGSRPVGGR